MADYYPLIARAVESLSEKSPELRRAVYDRARSALTEQLRALDPPVSEADIARERRSLDDAIGRIEAGYRATPKEALKPAPLAAAAPPQPKRPESRPAAADLEEDFLPEAGPPPPVPIRPRRRPERPPPEDRATEGEDSLNEGDAHAPQRERPRVETVARDAGAGRGRSVVLGLAVLLAVAAIAVTAWLLRDKPSDLPQQPATAEAARPAEGDAKFGDRVAGERAATGPSGSPAQPAPGVASRTEVPVSQRAILYEENQADPQTPRAIAGRAVWRLDALNAGQGRPLETVVRGTVEVSGANLTLNLVIRRNLDPALPASHTIELTFTTPNDPGRTVRDVGLLQLKNDEAVRGTPLAGLPVPVKENVFLLGLSNLPGDVERNSDLLLKRNWIDLPIRFASGSRAVLSFEKGVSGEQVFSDAFRQWGNS
jgi:hypothetical protein